MNEQYPVDRTRVVTTHVGPRSAEWLIAEDPEHGEGPMSPEELIAITRGEHFQSPLPRAAVRARTEAATRALSCTWIRCTGRFAASRRPARAATGTASATD